MRNPSEHAEQVAVVAWLRAQGLDFLAVPNGGRRDAREAASLKAEGVVAGAPDLLIFLPGPWIVALEMKARSGGRVSPAQAAWHERHAGLIGWHCLVCHGASEAIAALREIIG
jgi:hypothetical protein